MKSWSLLLIGGMVLAAIACVFGDENEGGTQPAGAGSSPQLGLGTFRVYENSVSAANLVAWVWRRPDIVLSKSRMEFWITRITFPTPSVTSGNITFVFVPVPETAGVALHHVDSAGHYDYQTFRTWVTTQGNHGDTSIPEVEIMDEFVHSYQKVN